MMGTCKGCSKENVELNDEGYCAECGGDAQHGGTTPATPATPDMPPAGGQ